LSSATRQDTCQQCKQTIWLIPDSNGSGAKWFDGSKHMRCLAAGLWPAQGQAEHKPQGQYEKPQAMTARIINRRYQLQQLAVELGVRPDWHEPDEQEVTAECRGSSFDNAGFGSTEYESSALHRYGHGGPVEQYVILKKDGWPVAEINLATLFAMACGWEGS
jgi:hypothetical protein